LHRSREPKEEIFATAVSVVANGSARFFVLAARQLAKVFLLKRVDLLRVIKEKQRRAWHGNADGCTRIDVDVIENGRVLLFLGVSHVPHGQVDLDYVGDGRLVKHDVRLLQGKDAVRVRLRVSNLKHVVFFT
jgi:hypothetical protein